jgi:hypothetical protein
MRPARNLVVPLIVIATSGSFPPGAAASRTLELTNMGERVPPGSIATAFNIASFPGFDCQGVAGGFELSANPNTPLYFPFVGAREAYSECVTKAGQHLEEEAFESKLSALKVASTGTVTETFAPAAQFSDFESGCRWNLTKLEGSLPASGYLEGIKVKGTVTRRARSARSCRRTVRVKGTLTVKPFEEAPGRYRVEGVR